MTANDQEIVKKMGEGFLSFSKEVTAGNEERAASIIAETLDLVKTADDQQAVLTEHISQRDELIAKAAQQDGFTLN